MATSSKFKSKRPIPYKNPLEALGNIAASSAQSSLDSAKSIGGGVLDQLTGSYFEHDDDDEQGFESFYGSIVREKNEKSQAPKQEKGALFRFNEHHENKIVVEKVKELTEIIKKEMEMLKRSSHELLADVKDINNMVINESDEKPGLYHIRFMELMVEFIQAVRSKISESGTWLAAMTSKRKKRGSAFMVRSKQKGTQYSLSQELQVTRSVQ